MGSYFRILFILPLLFCITLQAQNDYYFSEGSSFDPNIPTPEEYLGYSIGNHHTRVDRMVAYMQRLAAISDKANFEIIGYSSELRPQIVLTITAPDNYSKLETIRQEHLKIVQPNQKVDNIQDQPVVVLLGYNVHGNEPSCTEAAMLTAYYLVASTSPETADFLDKSVVFVDPAFNPDGRDRHSHWANMHKAQQLVSDPYDREHNEVWPGGRTNHYWFDLNRDWLPLAQVESRNRMKFYRKWLPNVVTDYHEMGTSSTYFFEPTEPFGSENPIVPRSNYDGLNNLFAKYYVDALDEIGSLYFTKEAFDNSYPGYGSTYPDIHGGLGMVFEQASSRGHLQQSTTEEVTFAFTIRNHLRTSIATVRASVENRVTLLQHQRTFFEDAQQKGKAASTKSYVFGDKYDWNRTRAFAKLLLDHGIETHQLQDDMSADGKEYKRGKAFVVHADQAQYLMVKTMFDPVTEFYDSVFYDASSWAAVYTFGMPHMRSSKRVASGNLLSMDDLANEEKSIPMAKYAYLIEWSDYLAPKALYHVLKSDVNVMASFRPFGATVNGQAMQFGYGSLMVPVADQSLSPEDLNKIINEAANSANIDIHTVETGYSLNGPDLGSRLFSTIRMPKVAMLVGEGSSSYEAGEIWHLLDTRYDMPITKVDIVDFGRLPLERYTTFVMASSGNALSANQIKKVKAWVSAGGTLILQRSAVSWAIRNKLIEEKPVENPNIKKGKDKEETLKERYDFETNRERNGAKRVGGVVFAADLDITHPLGFGYRDRNIYVYRNHNIMLQPSKSPIRTVVQYKNESQLDGYVHPETLEMIKGSASTLVSPIGRGKAICYIDNPNFRGFWYGTNRLFMNGLFFGGLF
ncbi:MAG: M14 metallopeptidase family protein [Bacteroidota bacterium]